MNLPTKLTVSRIIATFIVIIIGNMMYNKYCYNSYKY